MRTIDKQCLIFTPVRTGMYMLSALLVLFLAGCAADQPLNTVSEENEVDVLLSRGGGMNNNFAQTDAGLLRQVMGATARFHSTKQAEKEGYVVASHCVVSSDDSGAMGYHWLNQPLVNPVFELDKPEALLYEPDKNGNLKLVAIEYIVIDIGQPHPHFGDYPFDIGGTPVPVPHYSLHVWLWKNNPAGLFTPYNPDVRCP